MDNASHLAADGDRPVDDGTLAAAAAGDEAAFVRLYQAIAPRLRRYALSLVGQDADDVTGEAWLQIARDIRRFRGDLDDFRAWTARIVRNRAMDHLRSQARRRTDPLPTGELRELSVESDTATLVVEQLAADGVIRFISAALPREQAEAVILRAVIGLDSAAAGRVLDKSAAAVRVSGHRGLKSLARQLRAAAGRDGAGLTAAGLDGTDLSGTDLDTGRRT